MIDEEPSIDHNVLKTLYSSSLYSIDKNVKETVRKTEQVVKKKVLLLLHENLKEQDSLYSFLQGILGACRLKMDDVNLVPSFRQQDDYRRLAEKYGAAVVIMFGVEASDIQLPVFFPHYQVQLHDGVQYVSSPGLAVIENDKPEKQKLWQSLKKAFSL